MEYLGLCNMNEQYVVAKSGNATYKPPTIVQNHHEEGLYGVA